MELTTDIALKGTAWSIAFENFSTIFKTRPHYSLYILALSIGIMYDQRIEKLEDSGEEHASVPRNVVQNNDNGKLDFMFQAAILTTRTEELSEQHRLDLAFGEKTDFNKIAFLTQFANFGITKLNEKIGQSTLETMDNLKNFLFSTVEGRNLEVDSIPDDILLTDEI